MSKRVLTQQDINKIAKYIYKHTDGAYKLSFGVNQVDVYMYFYYHSGTSSDEPVKQMNLDINMTGYDNKIRLNVTEIDDMENTFVGTTIPVESLDTLEDLEYLRKIVYNKIVKGIEKEYADYDIIY